MFMFFISALVTTAFVFTDLSSYNLWIKPINMGLILGGLLFGFGMSLSVCCASGVLTDLSAGFTRAFVTLIFFCIGVFIGFPIQNTASWVRNSWLITATGIQINEGVFLPDLFKWDGFRGYLGALLLLGLFCFIITLISYYYEKKLKESKTYLGNKMEEEQDNGEELDLAKFKLFSKETYKHVFVKPWTLKQGAVVITIIFALLMGVTKAGWGASDPFGIWMGKILMLFGVSAESLANFTKLSADVFELPFFQHGVSVQNLGIVVGAIIYLLTAGKFKTAFTAELKINKKEAVLYALGGITMGFGTRLANGCNVGALYTPIANFSLSGWVFLVFMIVGGVISNRLFYSAPLIKRKSTGQQGQQLDI